jgi:hypothetical protein
MPKIVTKNPNGVFVLGSWSAPLGPDMITAVADNSDSTWVSPGGAIDPLYYDFEDISDAPPSGKVTAVTITYRMSGNAGADSSMSCLAIVNGSFFTGATGVGINAPPGFVTINQSWPGITTVGLWNSAKFGLEENWATSGSPLYKMQATITYELPSGGFAALVASLGPLIGVGLDQMGRVAAELHRLTGTLILPHEHAQAWRDIRSARHPRHFLFGRT